MSASKHKQPKILIIGIGNIGRGDDGLGWKMADYLSELELKNVSVEYRYQLQVEDAHLVSEFPIVVFVDASRQPLPGGYSWQTCSKADHYFYSSHLQSPETVLYLAGTLYNKSPESYILAIEGENWDLGEILSEKAEGHYKEALSFILNYLNSRKGLLHPPRSQSFA